jgi:hypothetical protein
MIRYILKYLIVKCSFDGSAAIPLTILILLVFYRPRGCAEVRMGHARITAMGERDAMRRRLRVAEIAQRARPRTTPDSA